MVVTKYSLKDYSINSDVKILSNESIIIIDELNTIFENIKPIEHKKKRNGRRHDYVDPNFKATIFNKFEGHDLLTSEIQTLINKLTKITYMKLREEIFKKIDEIIEKSDKEQKNAFVTSLIILISKNKFNSEINVSLYGELLDKYELFKNSKKILLNEYKVLSESIKTVSKENYDEFCDNNSLNDRRRAMGLFMTNMVKKRLLDDEIILEKIDFYQSKMNENMEIENMKELNEEYAENIYVLVVNTASELYNNERWKKILEEVRKITKIVVKEKKSFTSRAKFKHMDIITEYEKFVKENNIE